MPASGGFDRKRADALGYGDSKVLGGPIAVCDCSRPIEKGELPESSL
jgi:hypothetical protein